MNHSGVPEAGVIVERHPRRWGPDALAFTEAIPRRSIGKHLKGALREQCQGWYTSA